ncbi:hypothetical protein J1782_08405 [Rahnella sp. BCC 1045]|uniref:hypothetical protein n=1 Tax=Rahnella sp. BCC 1045 TaxID=2816251 RepID=UPI001C26DDA5|nr:hypothetical protein [Rahnella sp. BCC 1045]MBU9819907.1 hypothetical protein [Rahnella sp. BCC 1045]
MSQGFDQKDLEEICSRKPSKFKMKKADYRELGRNVLLGSVDVAIGCLGAAVLTVSTLNNRNNANRLENEQKERANRVWKRGNYIETNKYDD